VHNDVVVVIDPFAVSMIEDDDEDDQMIAASSSNRPRPS
jgi:hypothetical protein